MSSTAKSLGSRERLSAFILNYAIYIVLLILILIIVALDNTFLNTKNFGFILTQASTRVILALGVGGIIVLGGTDLSVGRMVGLAGVVSASLLQNLNNPNRIYSDMAELPLFVPILLVIVVCALVSGLSGFFVAKLHVTPFITTLGMMLIIYGANSAYYEKIGASPIGGLDVRFTRFAQGSIDLGLFRLPHLVISAVIATAIVWFIWNKTMLGRNMFAIGGNAEAAEVSGINIAANIIVVYIFAGILYGFAGSLEVARTGSATNNLGNGYEMDAIAACVVGGVSLMGGVGRISGIVTGTLIFQVINYGLVYIGVNPYMLYIIKGAIVIMAVAIDTQKYLKKK